MLPENETRTFLGQEYSWSKATLTLDDVQALFGGVRVWLPNWGEGYVTRVTRGGQENKFKVPVSRQDRDNLIHLCIEHDFLTIRPEERPGIPDEARPSITLTNYKRESHTVRKWASAADPRFDAVYDALLTIAARTDGRQPIPERFTTWQKLLFWLGIVGLMLLPFVAGFFLARLVVTSLWPDHAGWLLTLLLLFALMFPFVMVALRWQERYKATYDRLYTNVWLLIMLSWVYFALLVSLPGFLQRMSLAAWADTAVGTVLSLHQTTISDETGALDVYQVRYHFQIDDGRAYEMQAAVNRDTFINLEEGGLVEVHYLPFFPRYALLEYNVTAELVDYAVMLFTAVLALYLFLVETAVVGPTIMRIQAERF